MKKTLLIVLLYFSNIAFSQINTNNLAKHWIFNEFININNDMNDSVFINAFLGFERHWKREEVSFTSKNSKVDTTAELEFKFFQYSPIQTDLKSPLYIYNPPNVSFITAEILHKNKVIEVFRISGFEILDYTKFSNILKESFSYTRKDIDDLQILKLNFKNLRKSIKKKHSDFVIELRQMMCIGESKEYYYSIVM
jgi:hypothetical protein